MSPYKLRERVPTAINTTEQKKSGKMSKGVKVTIVTNDEKKTQVDLDIAKGCEVIKDGIEAFQDMVTEDIKVEMSKTQFKSIINYLMRAKKMQKNEEQPGITAWERRFFDGMDRNDFFGKIIIIFSLYDFISRFWWNVTRFFRLPKRCRLHRCSSLGRPWNHLYCWEDLGKKPKGSGWVFERQGRLPTRNYWWAD